MTSPARNKNDRIDFRVSSDTKTLLARAAELSGVKMSQFWIDVATERAQDIVAQHDQIELNDQARKIVLKALLSPPAPNAALKRAAKKFATR